MDTTKLLIKVENKILEKIGLLGNQKPEPKVRIPEIFMFGYSSPFYRSKILGTRTVNTSKLLQIRT